MTAAFRLNNREAKHELKVHNSNRILRFYPNPTYLGGKARQIDHVSHHLVEFRKKLSSRVTLLSQLVGSKWGAGAETLQAAVLSPAYSTAEYYALV